MADSRKLQTVVQVVAGLALNVYPAMFIAIYARIAPIDTQGFLAMALTVGVFIAQLLNAFLVEGRLATPDASHEVQVPIWIIAATVASGALLMFGPAVAPSVVLLVSSIGIQSGLLVGRSVGVVNGRWRREGVAAAVLVVAGLGALLMAAHHSPHAVRVLAAGAILAVLVRFQRRTTVSFWAFPPDLRRAGWVTAETGVVGVIQPTITSIVLVMIGPAASVTFRVISIVSGALEPILNYGRYRLLAHGHRGELGPFTAVFGVGFAAVLIAAFGGVGSLVFGPAWLQVGVTAVVLACVWKGLMLISTVPFTALRKAGLTVLVFWIRCASTGVYLVISVSVLLIWKNTAAVFAAFAVAEMVTAVFYHYAAAKCAPAYADSFGWHRLRRGA